MPLVSDIMKDIFVSVDPDLTVRKAAEILKDKDIGLVAVKKDNEIVGVVSERDLVRKVLVTNINPNDVKVKNVMTSPAISVKANIYIESAWLEMSKNKIRHLLVEDNEGKAIGIFSIRDVLDGLLGMKSVEEMTGFFERVMNKSVD